MSKIRAYDRPKIYETLRQLSNWINSRRRELPKRQSFIKNSWTNAKIDRHSRPRVKNLRNLRLANDESYWKKKENYLRKIEKFRVYETERRSERGVVSTERSIFEAMSQQTRWSWGPYRHRVEGVDNCLIDGGRR